MPSFDIVSEIDLVEVKNAVENASRELDTRFDFRGAEAKFELKEGVVTMTTESDFQLQQMKDILRAKCVKRNIDANSLESEDLVRIGKSFKQNIVFKQGIDQPMAKKIISKIKEAKVKVQASIQGEQLRVTGKKRDDLQQAMAIIKQADLGQPFQFNNFRD